MARRVAGMHEQRDRAILTVQRLLEAEGAVMQLPGFNPRRVRLFLRCRRVQGAMTALRCSLQNETTLQTMHISTLFETLPVLLMSTMRRLGRLDI